MPAAGRRALALAAALCALVAVLCALVAARCGDEPAPPPEVRGASLPVHWIEVGRHRISAEIAHTRRDRVRGLMFRESLPPEHGMLFLFPEEQVLSFWMRNTVVPLSIAYADARGRIVRIADLEPMSDRRVSSGQPARYALEMRRGWFREKGVREGDRIRGIPDVVVE